jgi:hypothetical protein
MKEKYLYLLYTLAIIFVLFTAGCVAPPQENSTFNPMASGKKTSGTPVTTTQGSYVSEVTLSDYASSATTSFGYTTFLPATRIPEDITCRIHSINVFGYNGTAFTFDLKNPPMFINYTVVPTNMTVNKVYTDSFTKKTTTRTYSDYSPSSWFEVTVRDNATKEIVLQEGFGENKGYSTYLTRTLKILKTGDLLVEFRGSSINASATIWVKPLGNFNESRLSEFTECTYWEGHRDTLVTPKPTTIKGVQYTWTTENKATSKAATMETRGKPPTINKTALYN